MDWSPLGSFARGIFQARLLELGCYFLLQEDLLASGIEPTSPALAGGLFTAKPPESPGHIRCHHKTAGSQLWFSSSAELLSRGWGLWPPLRDAWGRVTPGLDFLQKTGFLTPRSCCSSSFFTQTPDSFSQMQLHPLSISCFQQLGANCPPLQHHHRLRSPAVPTNLLCWPLVQRSP